MKYPTRIYYTEADKSLMWDRWQTRTSVEKENSVPIGGWVHAAVICFIKEGLIKAGLPSVQGQIYAPAKSAFPTSMWVKCRQNQ